MVAEIIFDWTTLRLLLFYIEMSEKTKMKNR